MLKRKRKGFTLVEFVIVMAIIGILVLMGAPKFINKIDTAKETKQKNNLKVYSSLIQGMVADEKIKIKELDATDKMTIFNDNFMSVKGEILGGEIKGDKIYNVNAILQGNGYTLEDDIFIDKDLNAYTYGHFDEDDIEKLIENLKYNSNLNAEEKIENLISGLPDGTKKEELKHKFENKKKEIEDKRAMFLAEIIQIGISEKKVVEEIQEDENLKPSFLNPIMPTDIEALNKTHNFFNKAGELEEININKNYYTIHSAALKRFEIDYTKNLIPIYDYESDILYLAKLKDGKDEVIISDGIIYNSNGIVVGLADDTIKNIVIPATIKDGLKTIKVSGIAPRAFYNISLDTVDLKKADNIEFIGYEAFRSTRAGGQLFIPKKVKSIGVYAFLYSEFTNITFDKGSELEYILNGAFEGSKNLVGEITFPDSLKEIKGMAFAKNKFTTIKFGRNIENIDGRAFLSTNKNQEDITVKIYIPKGIKTINSRAFYSRFKKEFFIEDSKEDFIKSLQDNSDDISTHKEWFGPKNTDVKFIYNYNLD